MEILFGVASNPRKPVLAVARTMSEHAAKFGFSGFSTLELPGVVISTATNDGAQAAQRTHDAGAVAFAWIGHVILDTLHPWAPAEAVCARLERTDFVPGAVDGLYAFSALDKRAGRLSIGTDRYGFWPLYFEPWGDAFLFSTSLAVLLSVGVRARRLNKEAIAEYLHFHYCLGDKTFVKSIQRVPQGQVLRLDVNHQCVSFEPYFEYRTAPEPIQTVTDSAVADLVSLFLDSVRRRIGHGRRSVCLLSGGFDSRAIACALSKLGASYHTLTTYGDTGVLDDPDSAHWVAEAWVCKIPMCRRRPIIWNDTGVAGAKQLMLPRRCTRGSVNFRRRTISRAR